MKISLQIIAILSLLCTGYWLGKPAADTAYEINKDSISISKNKYEKLQNKEKKIQDLEQRLNQLSQIDLEEYLNLKTQREKYLKADELLGKVMLALLANLSLELSSRQKDWVNRPMPIASMINEDGPKEKMANINQDPAEAKKQEVENEFQRETSARGKKEMHDWYSLENKKLISQGTEDKQRHREFEWPSEMLIESSEPISSMTKNTFYGKYVGVIYFKDKLNYQLELKLEENKDDQKYANLLFRAVGPDAQSEKLVLGGNIIPYYPTVRFNYGNMPGFRPIVINIANNYRLNIFRYNDRLDLYGALYKFEGKRNELIGKFIIRQDKMLVRFSRLPLVTSLKKILF